MPYAHDLFIVRDKETLLHQVLLDPKHSYLLEDKVVVQEFVQNHYESLIKVYAIGQRFDCVVKRTFPGQAVQTRLE